jgi:hypothetical protein
VAFLLGLALALTLAWGAKRLAARAGEAGTAAAGMAGAAGAGAAGGGAGPLAARLKVSEEALPLRPVGQPLGARERRWAEAAWAYIRNNTQAETGLVNSVDGFPSTTLWDTGSALMGVLAAEDLGLIPAAEAEERLSRALDSLARLPQCEEGLPNKAYDTRTLAMVTYNNEPVQKCIGWSTIDVARVGVPFNVLAWRRPALTPKVRAVLSRWKLSAAAAGGYLQGSDRRPDGTLALVQEGRFGYEQYAARSLMTLGLPVGLAMDYDANAALTRVSGQAVAHDVRAPEQHGGTPNPVLSEPYVLEGVEFGLDAVTAPLARAVLQAQMNRARETGQLTAVSEDNLDRDPRFVYSTVWSGGKPWAVFTPDNTPAEDFRTLSSKAAIGWGVLFAGPYPDRLLAAVDTLVEPDKGVYAGRYEKTGEVNRVLTANTNGIVLEVLAYGVRGPWLLGSRQEPGTGGSAR